MTLRVLCDAIEARARAIAGGRDWPCRKGCDLCCRRLAAPPLLTPPEWELLRRGLLLLEPADRAGVDARVRAMPSAGPLACPLLGAGGACLVYEQRPAACRAYGFYRERDRVLGCAEIERRSNDEEDVVWGNGEALEARLRELGEARGLRAWWDDPSG